MTGLEVNITFSPWGKPESHPSDSIHSCTHVALEVIWLCQAAPMQESVKLQVLHHSSAVVCVCGFQRKQQLGKMVWPS